MDTPKKLPFYLEPAAGGMGSFSFNLGDYVTASNAGSIASPPPAQLFPDGLPEIEQSGRPLVSPAHIEVTTPLDRMKYGGKAQSLQQLMSLGLRVPGAIVISCAETFTDSVVDRSDYFFASHWGSKYAVRSGAPISMPGLMRTELNVTANNIQEAIDRVRQSWFSPEAVAYRKAKNIPEDMGTAVIIQVMVKNPIHSGVAFTNDPKNIANIGAFAPIIEFVEGYGDSLVSGKQTPKRMAEGDATGLYELMRRSLRKIHIKFGPSDVEWAWNGNYLYFLQRRDIRFAFPNEETEEKAGATVFKGNPVGAPRTVSGIFNFLGKDMKAREVLYVPAFNPEYYPAMMESAGIVTLTGGETCHAAIIAQEFRIPAISNVPSYRAENWHGKMVQIDGATGEIRLAPEDAVVDPGSDFVPSPALIDPTRIPKLELKNKVYRPELLLARVYENIRRAKAGEISIERRDQIIREVADVLSLYFYMAAICEMRHMNNAASGSNTGLRLNFAKKFKALEVFIPPSDDPLNRPAYVTNYIKQPPTIERAIDIIETCRDAYNDMTWNGSFGGKPWGRIADIEYRYLTGKISPLLFVDACFNLQHNGGIAFGKFDWMASGTNELLKQLDQKQSGGDFIQPAVSLFAYGIGPEIVSHYLNDETLPDFNEVYSAAYKNRKAQQAVDPPPELDGETEKECGHDNCTNEDCCGHPECKECHPWLADHDDEEDEEEPEPEEEENDYPVEKEEPYEGIQPGRTPNGIAA